VTNLILLSGFLGAGKTTLLQRLLDTLKADGQQVAVVSNDFGPINIDAQLIESEGPVIEITDGSMFCSCREHDFVEGLLTLSQYPLDYVLVEASGLGDPANLGDLLNQAIKGWPELGYLGTVCVVDAEEVLELADLLQVVPRQVGYADLVLANKADLVSAEDLQLVLGWLEQTNTSAEVVPTRHCDIPLERLLGLLGHAKQAGHDQTLNTCESRMASAFLTVEDEVPADRLAAFLEKLGPRTHRIKGVVKSGGKQTEVSAVGARYELNPTDVVPRRYGLVLISSQDKAFYSDLVAGWESTVMLPMTLG
jgi:G3E family GTPase